MSKLRLLAAVVLLLLLGVGAAVMTCHRNGSWTKVYPAAVRFALPDGVTLTTAEVGHGNTVGGPPLSLYKWRSPKRIDGNVIHFEIQESGTTTGCGLITTDINRRTHTVIRAHFSDKSWGAYKVYNPDAIETGEITIDPSDERYQLHVDPIHYQFESPS